MSDRPEPQNPQQLVFKNVKVEGNLTTGDIHQTINVQEVPSHKPEITLQWMQRNFKEVKANAGARYTPEIHIDLPEAWVFEGLGRTDAFFDRIQSLYGQLYRRSNKAKPNNTLHQRFPAIAKSLEALHQPIAGMILALQQVDRDSLSVIDFQHIAELAEQAQTEEHNCYTATWDAESSLRTNTQQGDHQTEQTSRFDKEIIGGVRHNVSQLLDVVRKIAELATSASAEAANKKALLLLGEAGTGKTHLFCDVAKRRLEQELPTLILLGQHFNQSEPWSQILQRLQLPFRDRDKFLTALEIAAQVRRRRALILIDALNEGDGKHLWRNELPGILRVLENYPRIGLAVSCRTSYERMVIPEGLIPKSMTQVNHRGFADHEYIATTTFFNHYRIERPNIPLLVPEFSNPLFLKIFCQGLEKRELTRIPKGLKGVTAIFNFFIDAVHETLWRRLDYDPSANLAQQAVNLIARHMAKTGQPWVERADASTLVNSLLPGRSYQQSLFANLLSEGLLSEDLVYLPAKSEGTDIQQTDIVKFPYERFSDHLIVRYLLDTHLDISNPATSFASTQPLGNLVTDISHAYKNSGWIEALCVQTPERTGLELVELVSSVRTWYVTKHGFLQSLIWRDPIKVTEATKNYLNEIFAEDDWVKKVKVYDLMLTITAEPNHSFNARFLHQHLMRLDMPDRDQVWSIYLAQNYDQEGAIDRLLEWAWDAEKSHISDDAIELCAIALAWFLTTSHRYVRDRATKALVAMLHPRPHILIKVIEQFLEVNDPYVAERLYAIAYGVAMVSNANQAISELAGKVYEWVFANGSPPVNILLRDYARSVIETANYRGVLPSNVKIEQVRSPYQTEWPANIPTKEELKPYGETGKNMDDHEWARFSIYHSVMEFGDFARYIIGTNWGHFSWSSCRLGEVGKAKTLAIRKRKTEEFLQILTKRQKQAWERYKMVQSNLNCWKRMDFDKQIERFGQAFSEEEWDKIFADEEIRFLKMLGQKKQQLFREYVLPHLQDPQGNEFNFDQSLAQCWILKRVFDLGWTVERFGCFDRRFNHHYGRGANKAERIGKKYQWIGYHEFLAYVADNFEFIKDGFDEFTNHYDGPWQVSSQLRDIDPSLLLRRTPDADNAYTESLTTWWQPMQYVFAEADQEEQIAWIAQRDDCPDPLPWLEVTHPGNGSIWLTLEGHYSWTERGPIEKDPYDGLRRSMWFQVRSYITHQEDSEKLLTWLQEQNFMGRWMPESEGMYEVFVGEFPWASACAQYNNQEDAWGRRGDRLPAPVVVTTTSYTRESSSPDCSIDADISALMPSAWLIQKMGLRWSGGNFRYVDTSNDPAALDPSVEEAGPRALLVSRQKMVRFLEENKLVLIFTVLGERLIVGGHSEEWYGRLELSGAYSLQNDSQINGSLKAWHKGPQDDLI
jgi:hypothetical protein